MDNRSSRSGGNSLYSSKMSTERKQRHTIKNADLSILTEWFRANGDSAVVALSGGVDSAVVALAAAKAFGTRAVAITADYKTLASEELAAAKRVANEIGIDHRIIQYSELDNPEFVKNDSMRCYYCRFELGTHLRTEAQREGIHLVVDGTNADDLKDYRPGIKALRENGIRSPLAELGVSKQQVRNIAHRFGLSVHDRPSNACLASRIPRGVPVTFEKLKRIEDAEVMAKSVLGVRQLRVRDHGEIARIEVATDEMTKLFDVAKLAILNTKLKELGFRFVSFDAGGYRTGNLVVID